MISIIKDYKEFFIPRKISIVSLMILSILGTLIGLYLPIISGSIIDSLTKADNIYKFKIDVATLLVLSIINIINGYAINLKKYKLLTTITYELNEYLITVVYKWKFLTFQKFDSVYLTQRINNDANEIVAYILEIFIELVIKIILLITVSVILLKISIKIFLIVLFVSLIYIVAYKKRRNILYETGLNFKESQAEFFEKLNSQFNMFEFIKINVIYFQMLERLKVSYNNLFNSGLEYEKQGYLFGSLDGVVSIICQVLVYLVGFNLVFKREVSIGNFIIIINYFNSILSTISYFFMLGKTTQSAIVSRDRIQDILNSPQEKKGEIENFSIEEIKLSNLSLSICNCEILKNINCTMKKGLIYGISGNNGAGKTTLVRLLLGLFNEEYDGYCYINNHNFKDININWYRENKVSMVMQKPYVIGENFYDNLIYKDKKIDYNSLLYFDSLQNKNNMNNLSGGEKQKLNILRCMANHGEIIILDEPSSNLDKNARLDLIHYLEKIKKEHIIIIVTHDTDLMCICDNIISI